MQRPRAERTPGVIPKLDHRRVGLATPDHGEFRHLLTLGAIPSDGGITVTPAARPTSWGLFTGSVAADPADTVINTHREEVAGRTVKLHYHASGVTSVKIDDHGPEERVQLPKLDSLRFHGVFCLVQQQVENLTWSSKKKKDRRADPFGVLTGDVWSVVQKPWPGSTMIVGTVISHSRVPWLRQDFRTKSSPRHAVRGDTAYAAYDLRGHGVNAFMVLTIRHGPANPDFASTTLWGFALNRRGGPSQAVGLCSMDGRPVRPPPLNSMRPVLSWQPWKRTALRIGSMTPDLET